VIDAGTLPADMLAARPGDRSAEAVMADLEAVLATPRTFAELLAGASEAHQQDVIRALGDLRRRGRLQIEGDGRYVLTPVK